MGNLILCTAKPAPRPYYVAELGIHLYTAEELCYYIYNNLLLIDDSFPDERLFDFLRQLDQTRLEERVRRLREQGAGLYEILYVILQDLRYYISAELFTFRRQLDSLSQTTPAGRLKAKADALFGREQYYNAVRVYNQVLALEGKDPSGDFAAKIWFNKASCYARMENLADAMDCLQRAYVLTREDGLLEKMYALNMLLGDGTLPAGLEALVSEEKLEQFRSNLESRRDLARYQGKALEAAALTDKPEPERTESYLELLYSWKEEYRRNQTT